MLKDQDFKDMYFKIDSETDLKKVSNIRLCPSILKIPDSQARCLIYMYDQGSPFSRMYRDKLKRIEAISEYVGLSKKKSEQLADIEGDDILKCVIELLYAQRSRVWNMIVANEHIFYEYQQQIMSFTEMERDKDLLLALKTKAEVARLQEEISNRLDSLWDAYTGNDEVLQDRIAGSVRYTPESIADVS